MPYAIGVRLVSSAMCIRDMHEDSSYFIVPKCPFLARSNSYKNYINAGIFAFGRSYGVPAYDSGFRSVLIAK